MFLYGKNKSTSDIIMSRIILPLCTKDILIRFRKIHPNITIKICKKGTWQLLQKHCKKIKKKRKINRQTKTQKKTNRETKKYIYIQTNENTKENKQTNKQKSTYIFIRCIGSSAYLQILWCINVRVYLLYVNISLAGNTNFRRHCIIRTIICIKISARQFELLVRSASVTSRHQGNVDWICYLSINRLKKTHKKQMQKWDESKNNPGKVLKSIWYAQLNLLK